MPAEEPVLVIMDFPARRDGGPEQAAAMRALAESIAAEPGLIWKIWTQDVPGGRAGGIYLFASRAAAEAYHAMHAARLERQGIEVQTQDAALVHVAPSLLARLKE